VIARTEKRNKSGNMTPYPTGRGRPLTPERQALKQQAIILRKMGWSQPRIAKQIGIPQRTISLWFSKNGEFAIHAKPIRVSNNDKANIPANPTFLSWCGKLEDFTPENSSDLLIDSEFRGLIPQLSSEYYTTSLYVSGWCSYTTHSC